MCISLETGMDIHAQPSEKYTFSSKNQAIQRATDHSTAKSRQNYELFAIEQFHYFNLTDTRRTFDTPSDLPAVVSNVYFPRRNVAIL